MWFIWSLMYTSGPFRAPILATSTDSDQQSRPQSQAASAQTCESLQPVSSAPQTMGEQNFPMQRCSLGLHPFSTGGGGYRRIPVRLGSCVEPQDDQGCLESSGKTTAYKRAGATCCSTGSQAFPSCPDGKKCSGPFRQHFYGLSHKPPGRHQIQSFTGGGSETPSVGSTSPSECQSNSSARRAESCRRLAFQTETTTRGMETESSGGPDDLEKIRSGKGRSLCFEHDNTLSKMVLSLRTEQSTRTGCLGTPMARLPSICLPPSSTIDVDSTQNRSEQTQSASSCSILARKNMVSHASQTPQWETLASSQEEGPVIPTGGGAFGILTRSAFVCACGH